MHHSIMIIIRLNHLMFGLKRKVSSVSRFIKQTEPFLSEIQMEVFVLVISFGFVGFCQIRIGIGGIVIQAAVFPVPEILS